MFEFVFPLNACLEVVPEPTSGTTSKHELK